MTFRYFIYTTRGQMSIPLTPCLFNHQIPVYLNRLVPRFGSSQTKKTFEHSLSFLARPLGSRYLIGFSRPSERS